MVVVTWALPPPLYVIDGAIADTTVFSNLAPNIIEPISSLKDAASSAVHMRGETHS